jgi:hypothetical protein
MALPARMAGSPGWLAAAARLEPAARLAGRPGRLAILGA